MNRQITSNEPLTLEKLRKLQKQLRDAPVVCPGCPHPAHRAFRCGVKTDGTRTCDCNVTFQLSPSK